MMDPQVVLDNGHLPPLALLLQSNEEVTKVIGVIAFIEDLKVNQASLHAYGSDNCNGVTSELQHPELHSWSQPTLRNFLPEIAGRLINVDDLIVGLLLHCGDQVLNINELLSSEVIVLGLTSPILIVWFLELDPIPVIVLLQGGVVELL